MSSKILIFGGTTEGRKLSECLTASGIPHSVSVATEYGEDILRRDGELDLIVGRKDTKEIKALIDKEGFLAVVDATHPFATKATLEIKNACRECGVKYLRFSRDTGSKCGGDDAAEKPVTAVNTLEEAIEILKQEEGNILLLTGSKDLQKITGKFKDKSRIYARVLPNEDSLKKCTDAGLCGKQIIAMQGPFSEQMNIALIKEIGAKVILTKESGKTGGLDEKIEAANKCNIKAVVIKNPETETGISSGLSFENVLGEIEKITGKTITNKKKITLAGIGPGSERFYTKELEEAIETADIIFGAKTVISGIYKDNVPLICEYRGSEIHRYLEENPIYENPLVVFSGDISLCSGAKSASELFLEKGYEVKRIVGISSVTLLAEKFGLSMENVQIKSAHGRECNTAGYAGTCGQLIILPSGVEDAKRICSEIFALPRPAAGKGIKIVIGYELGAADERIIHIDKEDDLKALSEDLRGRCLIYVNNPGAGENPAIKGLSDTEFIRGDVPMTKEEIRALSIRKLALTKNAVLYDIGAGTGSVSIEAALVSPDIKVYAVEKSEAATDLIRQNKEKFGVHNIDIIEAVAPDGIAQLPTPTHAFIGGSSGNMQEIIDTILKKNEETRIVINCVTLETLAEITEIARKNKDLSLDIIQVSVSRFREVGSHHLADALNPVYIAMLKKEPAQ